MTRVLGDGRIGHSKPHDITVLHHFHIQVLSNPQILGIAFYDRPCQYGLIIGVYALSKQTDHCHASRAWNFHLVANPNVPQTFLRNIDLQPQFG